MSAPVALLIADVDGTLLTDEKVLTPAAIDAARALRAAGIGLALTSGRPPRGMRMLIEPLALSLPYASFDGGSYVRPDGSVIEAKVLDPEVVRRTIAMLESHGLDVWVYRGVEWLVRRADAPHVEREEWTVRFPPRVVESFDALDGIAKIVGVSDDLAAVARCERDAEALPPGAFAARSQPYYLDVTHRDANKGEVVRTLSRWLHVPLASIATIGDMPSDVQMFEVGGLSIAMGNASSEVKARATFVTSSNAEEGFARALRDHVLPRAAVPTG